jgi:hypothetical protein
MSVSTTQANGPSQRHGAAANNRDRQQRRRTGHASAYLLLPDPAREQKTPLVCTMEGFGGGRRGAQRKSMLLAMCLALVLVVGGWLVGTLQGRIRTLEATAQEAAAQLARVQEQNQIALAAVATPAQQPAVAAAACPEATPAHVAGVTVNSSMFPHVQVTPPLMAAFERYAACALRLSTAPTTGAWQDTTRGVSVERSACTSVRHVMGDMHITVFERWPGRVALPVIPPKARLGFRRGHVV